MKKLFEGLKWKGNVYVALAAYLLVAMVLYSVCRVVFYAFNTDYFPSMTGVRWRQIMFGGLRFDLTAVLYSNSLLLVLMILPLAVRFQRWYQVIVRTLFVLINSVALATNMGDAVYYQFTLRRTTLSVFAQFKNEQNGWSLFFQFLFDYWYVALIWGLLVTALVWAQRLIKWGGTLTQKPLDVLRKWVGGDTHNHRSFYWWRPRRLRTQHAPHHAE